jgi:hypothetical protein
MLEKETNRNEGVNEGVNEGDRPLQTVIRSI